MTLTHSPTIRTNSNNRRTNSSNHKRKKNRNIYWPTLHAIMGMMEYLQPEDKILAVCGIISENTKTIAQRIPYHLKPAPTHLLMPESGKADLIFSTHRTGTVADSPWVTTSSTTNFHHTDEKEAKLISSRHAPVQVQASNVS